jgi:hypothetical protein
MSDLSDDRHCGKCRGDFKMKRLGGTGLSIHSLVHLFEVLSTIIVGMDGADGELPGTMNAAHLSRGRRERL